MTAEQTPEIPDEQIEQDPQLSEGREPGVIERSKVRILDLIAQYSAKDQEGIECDKLFFESSGLDSLDLGWSTNERDDVL